MRSATQGRRDVAGRVARAAVVVACLMAGGCSTVGNGRLVQLDAVDARTLLVPGRTTQADVRQAFGGGTVIHFDSGYETWHYIYREGLAKGWDDVPVINLITSQLDRPTKELVILFDPAGVLKRYSLQAYRSAGSDTKTP
jgi:hypothetical protein